MYNIADIRMFLFFFVISLLPLRNMIRRHSRSASQALFLYPDARHFATESIWNVLKILTCGFITPSLMLLIGSVSQGTYFYTHSIHFFNAIELKILGYWINLTNFQVF